MGGGRGSEWGVEERSYIHAPRLSSEACHVAMEMKLAGPSWHPEYVEAAKWSLDILQFV